MWGAIIGFIAPFLPDFVGMAKGHLDHKHEMESISLHGEIASKAATQQAQWRAEEIEVKEAGADIRSARKQRSSYGVQMLNAAQDAQWMVGKWAFSLAFLAFSGLDWFISTVRPAITYYVVGLWGAIKFAIIMGAYRETGDLIEVLTRPEMWSSFDQDVLLMILAFWFSDAALRRRKMGSR